MCLALQIIYKIVKLYFDYSKVLLMWLVVPWQLVQLNEVIFLDRPISL